MSDPTPTTANPPPPGPKAGKWWRPLIEFAVHSVLGTGIFVIIFLPAVGVNIAVHALEERHRVSEWLIWTATAAEAALVGVDIILYVVFLAKTGWRAAKEL